ncbi:LuxR C-terminal-related transcriptional regulator [Streptomyces sp. NPDC014746]|uniref:helix-turn-helix transcriptional regulator n=1 Tax=Streptomyces sp. NPDC014746 TaxID=3364904 RepID=UPI0036F65588
MPDAGGLVSDHDVRLYREIQDGSGRLKVDDPRLEKLRHLGVVFTEPLANRPVARPLPQVERELMHAQLDELDLLLRRMRQIPAALDSLSQVAPDRQPGTNGIEIMEAGDAVHALLHNAIETSTIVWSSQTKPRDIGRLTASTRRDVEILTRKASLGIEADWRNLYPTGARTRSAETAYAEQTAATGMSQSRTYSRRAPRVIVTDTVALISDRRVGEGSVEPAVVVRDPALLAWLREEYELHWEAADRWFPTPPDSPSDRELFERDILQMLSEGSTRDAIARSLEISTRTYSTYMAGLIERFRVRTKEQLMYEFGRQRTVPGS